MNAVNASRLALAPSVAASGAGRADQTDVVAALRTPAAFGPGCEAVDVIETHLSYVFLTGRHAYKVKKAVRFPFVDFSTLEARRRCCELEVQLNRRTAPSLYLGVVPIVRCDRRFEIRDAGDAVEWAIRMLQFPQHALLSRMVADGAVTIAQVDNLAERIAKFHASIAERAPVEPYGRPGEVLRLALDNFDEMASLGARVAGPGQLERLRAWTVREHAARAALIEERVRGGFVRPCHGDLHLDNIVLVDGELLPFDGIEFNPALQWCDVIADIAYAAMDLRAHGRSDLARRLVGRYLEASGDYAGVPLLRFHMVYRAMVRAKVAALRARQQSNVDDARAQRRRAAAYLGLAEALVPAGARTLVAMHGLSGSGKTVLSQALLEQADVVRVRTDVERKRLAGLASDARSASPVDGGLYSADQSRAVYDHVACIARAMLDAGQPVVVDGALLRRWQRDMFRNLAQDCGARFVLLDVAASHAALRERVAARSASARDASEADLAVLERQIATHEPLGADERAHVLTFDGVRDDALASARWRALVETLSPPAADEAVGTRPSKEAPCTSAS